MSFCSMTGYTILRVFRDYGETRRNSEIFGYVSNGCNRDGLAIRAAGSLMAVSPYEHRILIILSDVKPNDVRKIPGTGDEEFIPYEASAGVRDTAFEVRRLRADGIAVVCVFTGDDEDVGSAKEVYGRDFARIRSLDQLADTVGMLIQNQIKNL
jgi:nitric oxide reductase activation protein